MNGILATRCLGFHRYGKDILRNITLTFGAGSFVSVLGANGAGKTTLLRLLLGLIRPTNGDILLQQKTLLSWPRRQIARQIAYVPQNRDKPPPYTVSQIVQLGRLPYRCLSEKLGQDDQISVDQAMACLDLERLRDRVCSALSGGEYQRVLLARAIAQQTGILVLDEPLAGLDFGHQLRLMAMLGEFAQTGRLVIMTAHQPDLVYRYASRILLLQNGRLTGDGAPSEILTGDGLSDFYQTPIRHHDHGHSRFFASRTED